MVFCCQPINFLFFLARVSPQRRLKPSLERDAIAPGPFQLKKRFLEALREHPNAFSIDKAWLSTPVLAREVERPPRLWRVPNQLRQTFEPITRVKSRCPKLSGRRSVARLGMQDVKSERRGLEEE